MDARVKEPLGLGFLGGHGGGWWGRAAVLTAHDSSTPYGISTISGMSTLIWNGLKPVIIKATKPGSGAAGLIPRR